MADSSIYQARALVLVVDDDVTVCSIAHAYLQLEGYRVKTATNGQEALAVLREHMPCAIVADLRMPLMDGAALRRWQLATAAVADVPFVLMSASPSLLQEAKTLAVAVVLEKPFANEELKAAIQRVCRPASF